MVESSQTRHHPPGLGHRPTRCPCRYPEQTDDAACVALERARRLCLCRHRRRHEPHHVSPSFRRAAKAGRWAWAVLGSLVENWYSRKGGIHLRLQEAHDLRAERMDGPVPGGIGKPPHSRGRRPQGLSLYAARQEDRRECQRPLVSACRTPALGGQVADKRHMRTHRDKGVAGKTYVLRIISQLPVLLVL